MTKFLDESNRFCYSTNSQTSNHNYQQINQQSNQNSSSYDLSEINDYSLFEAIDLCMPFTNSDLNNSFQSNVHNNNNNSNINNSSIINNYNNNVNMKYINFSNNQNQEFIPRSNSVPICYFSFKSNDDINKKSNTLSELDQELSIQSINYNSTNSNSIDSQNQENTNEIISINQSISDTTNLSSLDLQQIELNKNDKTTNMESESLNVLSNDYTHHNVTESDTKAFVQDSSSMSDNCSTPNKTNTSSNHQENTNTNTTTNNNNSNNNKQKKKSSKKNTKSQPQNDLPRSDLNNVINEKISLSNENGIDFKPFIENQYCLVYTCLARACGLEFNSKSDLNIHLKNSHGLQFDENNETIVNQYGKLSYKCMFTNETISQIPCGKKLENFNKIANHIFKDHSINSVLDKFKQKINSQQDLSPVTMSGSVSASQSNSSNNNSNTTFTNYDLSILDEKFYNSKGVFLCSYNDCTQIFPNENSLKSHKQTHIKNDSLNSNAKITQTPKKKHICSVCGSKFIRPSHLKAHEKLHESNDCKFKCDYCNEMFYKQASLLSHISKNHKDEHKILKCTYEGCNREFLTKMYLESHITKTHKQIINESERFCSICNKVFAAFWLKRQHDEVKHKGNQMFKCLYENCNKTFPTSSKLQRHSQTHLKEKKFKCEFENCKAEFNRREHLMSHLNMHNSGKVFTCDFPNCKATLRYYSNLLTHKKTHCKNHDKSNDKQKIINTNNEKSNLFINENLSTDLEDSKLNENQQNSTISEFNSDISTTSTTTTTNNNNNNLNISIDFNTNKVSDKINILPYELNVFNKLNNRFNCAYCDLEFESKENLEIHQKSHLDIRKATDKFNEYLETFSNEKSEQHIQFDRNKNAQQTLVSNDSIFYYNFNREKISNDQIINASCHQTNQNDSNLKLPVTNINLTNGKKQDCLDYSSQPINIGSSVPSIKPKIIKITAVTPCLSLNNNPIGMNQFINEIPSTENNTISNEKFNGTIINNNETDTLISKCSSTEAVNLVNSIMGTSSSLNEYNQSQSNDFISFLNQDSNSDYDKTKNLKQEHIININSDDEEYTTCSVVLENLSGSARTDYKSNHIYIEKNKSKRKQKDKLLSAKRIKTVVETEIEDNYESSKSTSPLSTASSMSTGSTATSPIPLSFSSITSPIISIKTTLKQTLTSKQSQTPKKNKKSPKRDLNSALIQLQKTQQEQQEKQQQQLLVGHSDNKNNTTTTSPFVNCTGCLEF